MQVLSKKTEYRIPFASNDGIRSINGDSLPLRSEKFLKRQHVLCLRNKLHAGNIIDVLWIFIGYFWDLLYYFLLGPQYYRKFL